MKKISSPVAVIDVGTNTFHLLIATPKPGGGFEENFRERRFVKLAQEGIEYIGPSAWQRGMESMRDYRHLMDQWQVGEVRAFGTAALRTAENGAAFAEEVFLQTGIRIQLIDGLQEAAYILRGVRLAVPFDETPMLVMDIGGGSVEFLIANREQVFWAQSFPIGVAVLYRKFHHQEPISKEETQRLEAFLDQQLDPLRNALQQYPVRSLVGVAGTFDVLENLLDQKVQQEQYTVLDLRRFPTLRERVCNATLEERLHIKGMPPFRADMIPSALILIGKVLEMGDIPDIRVSHYDLKEGIVDELLEGL